jgi:ABC-type uncharacterized transport system permease subunit
MTAGARLDRGGPWWCSRAGKPFRLLAGAYLFGLVHDHGAFTPRPAAGRFRPFRPSSGRPCPYLATIVVLVLISIRRDASSNAPACLGRAVLAQQLEWQRNDHSNQ